MLDEKTVAKTLVIGLGGWLFSCGLDPYDTDRGQAHGCVATKVVELLTPLWEDFIRRNDGNLADQCDSRYSTAAETKVEQGSEVKSELQAPSWFQRESALRW